MIPQLCFFRELFKIYLFSCCIVRPTHPTDVMFKIEETVTLCITWKEPQCGGQHGIEGYFIYYKAKGKGQKTPLLKCCDHKIQNLQEGTDYDVYMVAVDSKGTEGMPSKIKSVKMGGKL